MTIRLTAMSKIGQRLYLVISGTLKGNVELRTEENLVTTLYDYFEPAAELVFELEDRCLSASSTYTEKVADAVRLANKYRRAEHVLEWKHWSPTKKG